MNITNGTAPTPMNPAWVAESNTARIITVVTVFHLLAQTSVALRIYARIWVIKAPGWDDAVMICAWGGWISFVIQAQYGLGKHFSTIDKKYDYVVFNHVSIALSLLRLSKTGWYKWALWSTIALVLFYSIGGMFPFFLHCKPLSGFWDRNTTPPPKCKDGNNINLFGIINTGFNIFTDVVLATLPVPIIWNLQMKRRLRLYAIGILSLGYFAVAMGIVKAVYQLNNDSEPDKTFNRSIQFWGFLQLQVGIIAACAPALKPLVNKLLNLSAYNQHLPDACGKRSQQTGSGPRTLEYDTSRSRSDGTTRSDQYELDEWALDPRYGTQTGEIRLHTMQPPAGIMLSEYDRSKALRIEEETAIQVQSSNLHGIIKTTEFARRSEHLD
ncbi:Integral membrane protein [Colletotrichum scovillei]|uniref:Integral membrane protein n=1 Tax=Colletotrichum scovillei TaxID=1209932 RepID=A0A9P7U6S0_9PEZI|nr:Integral membrane protein [Colletotrichum scovillei]KAG7061799.1 Integral membrane protein [Colletotrichum scovillei]